eukprot:Skav208508  [mRNA]  locus=scaffold1658:212929:218160:+ [translate_table: standard]
MQQIVAKESAGKSTILETLPMLPFFPRKRRCCTRMAIHLRMRRTPGRSRVTLTVLSVNLEVELSREIPQENGWLSVQAGVEIVVVVVVVVGGRSLFVVISLVDAFVVLVVVVVVVMTMLTRMLMPVVHVALCLMKELFGGAKKEQIISEKIIEVRVERPDVPCLDLVDLPGMAQLPQEKAEQVNKIYQRQLQDDRESGNQCIKRTTVPEHLDLEYPSAELAIRAKQEDESPESVGAVALKNGWVCTMQKYLGTTEVSRRLGPDSEVTQKIYKSFVADVLHTTVVAEVWKIFGNFENGQLCAGMLDGVRDILLTESVLCKDEPLNFNIQTASLRLYHKESCKSQWEAEPIIQLCHFKEYVAEIMKKHIEMLGRCKQNLRGSLETLINRLFDVDFPSPYLEAAKICQVIVSEPEGS